MSAELDVQLRWRDHGWSTSDPVGTRSAEEIRTGEQARWSSSAAAIQIEIAQETQVPGLALSGGGLACNLLLRAYMPPTKMGPRWDPEKNPGMGPYSWIPIPQYGTLIAQGNSQ